MERLVEAIHSLAPEDQESVRAFVEFLKGKAQSSPSPFLCAADEFIEQHPELIRHLA
ncbi:MAG: hypothetical protein ABI972_13170 [Acidobacteriota bacterium]